MTVAPIVINFLIECATTQKPGANIWPGGWDSPAGKQTRIPAEQRAGRCRLCAHGARQGLARCDPQRADAGRPCEQRG
ncbi:hypothetical protein [Synechococcus phage Ssp-JY39]|nr:hypothetical protein [Synechococcus phage Yong-M2-251]